jgi:serine/threonine protein kinase
MERGMDQLQPGQMLGSYRIIDQIGQGGMATIYKAYQPSMDRTVAVKVLPSQLASSREFTQRFQQEAHIIARLEHPHILPVFDYGESNGVTYLVMRYLDAGTLKDKMEADRPLPLDEIDRIFTQLADALSYAHSHGVVHRDLKPSNVLVDLQGNLFLTDFGFAKWLESASPRLTQTDAIMGTPAYISPEQAQAAEVDQRSDIYSFGIILYEMVTGRVPFVADTPLAVIFKHVSDPLPLPSTLKPDISEAIERVILKALAKNPEDRFATVSEFESAWKRALEETRSSQRVPETVISSPPHTSASEPIHPAPAISRPLYDTSVDQPQDRPAMAPTAASRTRGRAGWVIGCLVSACALFSIAGVSVFVLNWDGFSVSTTSPETLQPTQTAIPTQPTNTPSPTEMTVHTTGEIILEDDFSDDNIWGILDSTTASIQYDGNALRMKLFEPNWSVWSTPNSDIYENVHLETTAYNNDGEASTAFGIICYQQELTGSYYYVVMTPAGEYAIAKASEGNDDVFLTNNDQWAFSDLIERDAPSYRVGVDCGYGMFVLYVGGQLIDIAYDETYANGGVGLILWSGEEVSSADVTYDDFIIKSLE